MGQNGVTTVTRKTSTEGTGAGDRVQSPTANDDYINHACAMKQLPDWGLPGRWAHQAEAPVFWSSDVNIQLIGKDPDAGKD